jgi:hypothetical protein
MYHMAPRGVSMVCRLFVMSGVVMLSGFPVVVGGMREMFWRLLVVFGSFLRHGIFLRGILKFETKKITPGDGTFPLPGRVSLARVIR